MKPPTPAQQKAFAIAPIPFATISFLASLYVIYYLLCKERQRLERMYHRLVLAMNFALLPLTFTYAWSTFAVPEGTPNYYGASGTTATCTAQGFLYVMFALTVPTYYMSLSLQAFMGIKHNFQEEKYRWIEKYIHAVAYCIPAALATVFVITESYNPNGSGCAVTKYPVGCETDPDVPCERGGDVWLIEYLVGLSTVLLYFVGPPVLVTAMYCWIRKRRTTARDSTGMQQIREQAQKELMKSILVQISVYLFSFWFTFAPTLVNIVYQILTREIHYELTIFANCVFALQGLIMAVVYFLLQRMGSSKVAIIELVPSQPRRELSEGQGLTVTDIRKSVMRQDDNDGEKRVSDRRESYIFNIFDGEPDEDSPWARFIDQSYVSENHESV